jgi:hypothetical protein
MRERERQRKGSAISKPKGEASEETDPAGTLILHSSLPRDLPVRGTLLWQNNSEAFPNLKKPGELPIPLPW